MKKDKALIVFILALLLILGASYYDRKDAEAQAIDDEIRQIEFEGLQPR